MICNLSGNLLEWDIEPLAKILVALVVYYPALDLGQDDMKCGSCAAGRCRRFVRAFMLKEPRRPAATLGHDRLDDDTGPHIAVLYFWQMLNLKGTRTALSSSYSRNPRDGSIATAR